MYSVKFTARAYRFPLCCVTRCSISSTVRADSTRRVGMPVSSIRSSASMGSSVSVRSRQIWSSVRLRLLWDRLTDGATGLGSVFCRA